MVVEFGLDGETFALSGNAAIDTGHIFENVNWTDEECDDEEGKNMSVPKFPGVGITVDLTSVLGSIVQEGDRFLPSTLYIRDCMNKFLGIFCGSADRERRIVMGAPGVGKSVLSFLAYLLEAANHNRSILYVRRTNQSNEKTSVFFITNKGSKTGEAMVQFCRQVREDSSIVKIFGATRPIQENGDFLMVTDGPRHGDKNGVRPQWDLITSGGHPALKSAQMSNMRFVILNSWSEQDSIACAKVLKKLTKAEAKADYDIAGGSVRDLLSNNKTRRRLHQTRRAVIENLGDEEVELIVQKSTRPADGTSIDSLRAMYAADEFLEDSYQTVQSTLYLRYLRANISIESAKKDLEKAKMLNNGTLYGIFFELYAHTAMKTLSKLQDSPNSGNRAIKFDTVTGNGEGSSAHRC